MDKLSNAAREAKNEYARQWKKNNLDKVKAYHRNWRKNNPDKVKANNIKYWERKAANISIDQQVIKFYNEGLSYREISKRLDLYPMKVKRIVDEKRMQF